MRKIFAITVGLMMMGIALVSAAENESLPPADLSKKEGKLVTMTTSSGSTSQLERRMDRIEREMRSQNDAIRNLERDISDLRRRR